MTGVINIDTTPEAHPCEVCLEPAWAIMALPTSSAGSMVTVGVAGVGGSGNMVTVHGHDCPRNDTITAVIPSAPSSATTT